MYNSSIVLKLINYTSSACDSSLQQLSLSGMTSSGDLCVDFHCLPPFSGFHHLCRIVELTLSKWPQTSVANADDELLWSSPLSSLTGLVDWYSNCVVHGWESRVMPGATKLYCAVGMKWINITRSSWDNRFCSTIYTELLSISWLYLVGM